MRLRLWLIEASPVCPLCPLSQGCDEWGEPCATCKGKGRLLPQINVERKDDGVILMDRRGRRITGTPAELEQVRQMANFIEEPFSEVVGDTK
jgi:hypothetical protein